jgi:hypothetical protein
MSYGQRETTRGSSEEHQKSREGGKTKADFKTFAEENATSARQQAAKVRQSRR